MKSCAELKVELESYFKIPFECLQDSPDNVSIKPCGIFDRGSGCRIVLSSPFLGVYRAKLEFETCSAPLISFWFDHLDNVGKGFDFVERQTKNAETSFSFCNKRVSDPKEFAALNTLNWRSNGLSALLTVRSNATQDESLATAIAMVGFVLFASGCTAKPPETHFEGQAFTVRLTRYERDPHNRAECIEHYGAKCYVCGLKPEEKYGDVAKDLIEVHHKKPLSTYGGNIAVDPISDLVPLCPNCHAVVHRQDPPIDPDDLSRILEGSKE